MRRFGLTLPTLAIAMGLLTAGCPGDPDPAPAGGSTEGPDTDPGPADSSDDGVDPPGTTDGDPPGTTDGDPDTTGDTETTGDSEFMFDDSPPEAYTQVDRMGMPAVNTGVISSKDEYNASSPSDDAAGTFVSEIVANLTGLHAALDDDLMGAGLVPCAVDDCVAQAAPLVVPDMLALNLQADAGFPNGRTPTDTVMDVTLAVILLDLSAPGQTAGSLIGLNPTANDVAFSDEFPYFAEAHQ